MIRKSITWNVKQVCSMIQKGSMVFSHPLQRPPGQWKQEDQSLLIHSILTMFIPDIYILQTKTENGNVYDVIDGLQRLTIICGYLNDQWELTQLEPIKLDSTGEVFNISGMKFSDLPGTVQEEIKGYSLSFKIMELEEDDDEEELIEDIFYRLNNGKAVSREHLALVSAPSNVQQFVRRMVTESELFNTVAHFAPGAIKKSAREITILQSIMLISGLDFESFAARHVEQFFTSNPITDNVLEQTEKCFDLIVEAFGKKTKFINKINIPMLVSLYNSIEDTAKVEEFTLFYSENTQKDDAYRQFCGAGSVKKENVQGRISALQQMFADFQQ